LKKLTAALIVSVLCLFLTTTVWAGDKAKASKGLSPAAKAWEKTGKYMTVDGHKVFYHDVGKGPVILLLHGHPSSSNDWEGVIERLKSHARLVSFDHVGWGLSDKPVAFSYSLMQLTDITEGVVKNLGIKKAHVVSHDISGSVHTEILARNLEGSLSFELLSSMFTNGSILQWISTEPDSQNLAAHNETLFQAMEGFKKFGAELPGFFKHATLGNFSEEQISLKTELLIRDDGLSRLAAQSGYMRERYLYADRWVGAMEKTTPMRIVWSVDDPIANVSIGRELEQRCPKAVYVEKKGMGHFPNAENPEFIAKQIALSAGL